MLKLSVNLAAMKCYRGPNQVIFACHVWF
uniref:Uncharacterized protein n=1 Tax=Arundo donax TaxID=35708 RepID=A0A0A8ZKF1_ARUDO